MPNTSKTEELYNLCDSTGIDVIFGFFPACKSLSIPAHIALDYDLSGAEETVCLAHEIGHVMRGAFYGMNSTALDRQRAENRADRWAIKKLVPAAELKQALKKGYQIYEIAEMFSVTEQLIGKACALYFT